MLSGACLSDDARLSDLLGQQGLAENVVDLVRAGVVEILALEEHPDPAQIRGKAGRFGQQRGPTRVVRQEVTKPTLKGPIAPQALPRHLDLLEGTHERLRNETPAKVPEVRPRHEVIGFHHCPS